MHAVQFSHSTVTYSYTVRPLLINETSFRHSQKKSRTFPSIETKFKFILFPNLNVKALKKLQHPFCV